GRRGGGTAVGGRAEISRGPGGCLAMSAIYTVAHHTAAAGREASSQRSFFLNGHERGGNPCLGKLTRVILATGSPSPNPSLKALQVLSEREISHDKVVGLPFIEPLRSGLLSLIVLRAARRWPREQETTKVARR